MELTPQDCVAAALAEPADSRERWAHVHSLHRRGDEAAFQAAVDLLDSPESPGACSPRTFLVSWAVEESVPSENRPCRRIAGYLGR